MIYNQKMNINMFLLRTLSLWDTNRLFLTYLQEKSTGDLKPSEDTKESEEIQEKVVESLGFEDCQISSNIPV